MNEQQLAAATAPNGYVQIIAGPGTGKTFTLVQRIVELLNRGIDPTGIVVVTFTRAAAHEILERVNKEAGTTNKLTIGTFHSVALRLLRRYGGEPYRRLSVIDEHDKADILRGMSCVDGSGVRKLSKEISNIKMGGDDSALEPGLREVYQQYEQQLAALNKVDFDGLLVRFRDFLKTNELIKNVVNAVLVDEFQDTSLLQLEIASLLGQRCANMTVVGDPDQSIYAFRNADPRNFMEMAKQVDTQKLYLEKNYRSEQSILTAALRVIKESKTRYASDRTLIAAKARTNAQVQFVRSMSPHEEARMVASSIRFLIDSGVHHDEICVLSRYSSKLQSVEAALLASGIPSRVVGGKRLAEQREVRLIIDYLRVALDDNDSLAIERTVNNPKRGFGEKTLSRARNKNGFLTLHRIRTLATEQSQRYTSIVDSIRKRITTNSIRDLETAVENANALVDHIASMLFDFDPANPTPEIGVHLEAIKGAISQFQELAMDVDDDDDRTFLEAFVDHWALGADTTPTADSAEQDKGRVTLSTIHSAKGLEWPVVYMIDSSEDDYLGQVKRDIEEERRLLYVAMTRAKSVLIVSSASTKTGFNSLLQVPKAAVQTEINAPEMTSLSACVGRELKCIHMDQKRSVLGKSKRLNAKTSVELPPGFLLASELPQGPQKYQAMPSASHKSSFSSSKNSEPERISKKGPKKPNKTLIDFFSRPKANN